MVHQEKESKLCLVLVYWKSILARALLALHCLLAVWRVTLAKQDDRYWLLLLLCLLFAVEGFITNLKRKLDEKSVVSFCFLLYLASVLPPIWLLEIDRHEKLLHSKIVENVTTVLSTSAPVRTENNTVPTVDVIGQQIYSLFDLQLDPETWVLTIEETVIYMLFIARWLLPRGRVSREQLSDMLMDFLGSGSDIMEFFGLFGFQAVACDTKLTYLVLGFWSLSLTRFTLSLKKVTNGSIVRRSASVRRKAVRVITEIAEIVTAIFLQDGPFLVVRAYAMSKYKLVSYSLIFFLIKNVLLILLSMYRVLVKVMTHPCWELPAKEETKDANYLEWTMVDPPGIIKINNISEQEVPEVNTVDETHVRGLDDENESNNEGL